MKCDIIEVECRAHSFRISTFQLDQMDGFFVCVFIQCVLFVGILMSVDMDVAIR